MTVKSTKLKGVGAQSFSETYSKVTFVLPKSKAASYKKLIKKGNPPTNAIYK